MSEFHVLSCSLSRFKDTDVALGRQRQESNTSDQQRQSEREREVHTPRSPCETSETDQHGPTGRRWSWWNKWTLYETDRRDEWQTDLTIFFIFFQKCFFFFINLQNSKILESLLDSDVFGNRLLAFAALTATFQVNSRGHAFKLNYRIFYIILFVLNIAVPSV